MKKTFLTFVAFGFGLSVAFAQTTVPQEETQEEVQMEQNDAMMAEEDGRKQIEMYELPVAVQDAFKNGQYKDYQVLAIYEVTAEGQDASDIQESEGAAATQAGVIYEIELAAEGETYGSEQTVEEDGMEGIETERVSARQPDVILLFDENGQLIEEEQPEEEKY